MRRWNTRKQRRIRKNIFSKKIGGEGQRYYAFSTGGAHQFLGRRNTEDYINMDAIVYLKPDFTDEDLHALIEEVKALDQDETQYRKKFEQPLFKGVLYPPRLIWRP